MRRENKTMKDIPCVVIFVALFAFSFSAQAQQTKKVPRIGYLSSQSASADSSRLDAFRQALRDLDHIEGKTLSLTIDLQRESLIGFPNSQQSWSNRTTAKWKKDRVVEGVVS